MPVREQLELAGKAEIPQPFDVVGRMHEDAIDRRQAGDHIGHDVGRLNVKGFRSMKYNEQPGTYRMAAGHNRTQLLRRQKAEIELNDQSVEPLSLEHIEKRRDMAGAAGPAADDTVVIRSDEDINA